MRGERRQARAAAAVVAALIAAAVPADPGPAADGEPATLVASAAAPAAGDAPVQLVVNAQEREVVIVRLEPGGDAWMPVASLLAAGLRDVRGVRRTIGDAEWVSLRSLAPAVTFGLDERTLQLRVDARPELLGRVGIDGAEALRPEGMLTAGSPSAFVNYAVQGDQDRQVSAFAELGAGAGPLLASTGVSRGATGQVVRGLSAVTVEEASRLRRWTAGDAVASGGALGGNVVLGGVGVERDFALDPWFVKHPLPRTSAVALTPSTLEVYVNGRLVRRDTVAPGTVDLSNLPVEAGAGQVRTVLRDSYGRTQDVTAGYYFSAGLLAPGVSDYGLHAGLRRQAIPAGGASYSDAVALGRWRGGLGERLTAGGRAEAGRDLLSGGPQLTAGLGVGELELAAAGSTDGRSAGAAALAGWTFAARRASAGLRLQAMSREYVNASLAAAQDRALLLASAYGAVPVASAGAVGLEASISRMRDARDVARVALRGSVELGRGASILASLGWSREASGASGPAAMLILTQAFGNQTMASVQGERAADARARGSADVQRALPTGAGYGYRVETGSGDGALTSGTFQAQGDHGRVEASYQRVSGRGAGSAAASGGVVYMDGDLFLTRAVQDGFALVQVPGVEGVRAYLNSAEVGRTDARGNLLVPGLLPYHANRVGIRAADVPIDYELDAVERLVAPPRRVGARVRFEARRSQTVTGTLAIAARGGDVTPAYGELRVAGANASSPIGSDGRFYLTAVGPGRHEAEVEYGGGVCRFPLEVPATSATVVDVGAVRCADAEWSYRSSSSSSPDSASSSQPSSSADSSSSSAAASSRAPRPARS